MTDIRRKILVKVRKSAPHIVVRLISALGNLLKPGYDQVIAPLSPGERAHPVVNFLSAIHAQNDICHLPVHKINDVVIQQDTVCREREAEFLVVRLLETPAVCHQILDDLPVHQRLPAEEIHLQIDAAA